jgi:hypothetical protein
MKPHAIGVLFSVAAGVPPAVEPGILPGRSSCQRRRQFRVQRRHSGRQDAALYGSQDGCRYSNVRSGKVPRSAARRCAILVLLLVTGLIGRAQSTNAVARLDYESFKIITDRNIFDPNRSSRSRTRTDGPRPARVESFALVGTMSYENGTYAFFDGTGSSYRKAIKTGDTIAGYKVSDISADRVKLEANGQQIELNVGVQMRKQEEGEWQLAGRAESFGTSSPATATTEKTDSASGGEESDVLKKLMQKREQELK